MTSKLQTSSLYATRCYCRKNVSWFHQHSRSISWKISTLAKGELEWKVWCTAMSTGQTWTKIEKTLSNHLKAVPWQPRHLLLNSIPGQKWIYHGQEFTLTSLAFLKDITTSLQSTVSRSSPKYTDAKTQLQKLG